MDYHLGTVKNKGPLQGLSKAPDKVPFFSQKVLTFFLFLNKNIWYSLISNQNMFSWRNKKKYLTNILFYLELCLAYMSIQNSYQHMHMYRDLGNISRQDILLNHKC